MSSTKHNDLNKEEERLLDSFKMHEIEARLGEEDEALVDYTEKPNDQPADGNEEERHLYLSEAVEIPEQMVGVESKKPVDEAPLDQRDPLEGTFGNPNAVTAQINYASDEESPKKDPPEQKQDKKVTAANPFHWEEDNLSRLVLRS